MLKGNFKRVILWITYAALLIFLMLNYSVLWSLVKFIYSVLRPFIFGFVVAYLINVPYMFFKDKAFGKIGTKTPKLKKLRQPLALITTYVILIGILTTLIVTIIPQLNSSISNLISNLQDYANSFTSFVNEMSESLNGIFGDTVTVDLSKELSDFVNKLVKDITESQSNVSLLSDFGTFAANAARSTFDFLYNWLMAIIVSVYFLISKEQLLRQAKKIVCAVFSKKKVEFISDVSHMSNRICGRYIYGRIIDSVIVGLVNFIAMTILNYEYALLISVVIGITNIIPIFGPFIGGIPSAFLLLMINPAHALGFIIWSVILQQVDGNIIVPKVLSDSMGISGFWVMFSVLVGGGLFGLTGMVIGVPVFVIIYILLGRYVNKKLTLKGYDKNADLKEQETEI